MENKKKTVEEAEQEASEFLKKELLEHNCLVVSIYNLMTKIINQFIDVYSQNEYTALLAAILLLTRISNDLRCVQLLCNRGYPIQAITLTTSIYETTFTIAYIGNDESLAQEWFDHEDPFKAFKNLTIFNLTKEAIKKLGFPDVDKKTDSYYKIYRELCMVKHCNPRFQQQHGYIAIKDGVLFKNGPDYSDSYIGLAWKALEIAFSLAGIATNSFVINFISDPEQTNIKNKLKKFEQKRKELALKRIQRWPI